MTFHRTRHLSAFARTTSGSILLSFHAARALAITAIFLCKHTCYYSVRFVLLHISDFGLPQNLLFSFETMAACVVRTISDSFRCVFCYALQGCTQCDTAPLSEKSNKETFVFA